VVVHDAHFGTTADDHFGILAFAAFLLHRTEFIDLELTVVLGNDLAVLGDLAGHTTHVERTQGKLCARFPDGLCSDHAHSFTDLDHASGGQVASVALRTHSVALFAGKYAAHLHFLYRAIANEGSGFFID